MPATPTATRQRKPAVRRPHVRSAAVLVQATPEAGDAALVRLTQDGREFWY